MGEAKRRKGFDPNYGKQRKKSKKVDDTPIYISDEDSSYFLKMTSNDFLKLVETKVNQYGIESFFGFFSEEVYNHLEKITQGVSFPIPVHIAKR